VILVRYLSTENGSKGAPLSAIEAWFPPLFVFFCAGYFLSTKSLFELLILNIIVGGLLINVLAASLVSKLMLSIICCYFMLFYLPFIYFNSILLLLLRPFSHAAVF
jgi:hypothetical protein